MHALYSSVCGNSDKPKDGSLYVYLDYNSGRCKKNLQNWNVLFTYI